MLAALPVIMGFQVLLAFFSYDIRMVPRQVIWIGELDQRRPGD